MKVTFTSLLLLLLVLSTTAQDHKRTAIWYFGQNAGLDFNTDPPTPLTDGQINTIEGCATICDTAGNLLFYTDGSTVWNKSHQVLSNGTGLLGDASSTQAALIVPQPGNDSIFYLFTTDKTAGSNGLCYSIINMKMNSGMGAVISKNKKLLSPIGEKLTAVKHKNNEDFWISTHEFGTNNFYCYLLNRSGIVECPVISSIGKSHSGPNLNAIGSFKFSPNGKLAALCLFTYGQVELFDFNNENGVFSKPRTITGLYSPNSLEFSMNSQLLYVSERDQYLLQYKIHDHIDSLQNSKHILYGPQFDALYNLQLSLNGSIYSALKDSTFLPVISNPNEDKDSANFLYNGTGLNSRKSLYGLPNFVSSYFDISSISFAYRLDCSSNAISISEYDIFGANDFKWEIVNKNSQIPENTSTARNPVFTFQDTGWYTIILIASNGTVTDSISKDIHIKPKYILNLGNDTTLCAGSSMQLEAGVGQHCYTWQDGSSSSSFLVDTSGIYYVAVTTNNFCTYTDSIHVDYSPYPSKPQITQNYDTLYSPPASSYQWFRNGVLINGANSVFYAATLNGHYQVEILNAYGCATLSDSFEMMNVGIPYNDIQKIFRVFPNPAKDILHIYPSDHLNEPYSVKLLNAGGLEVVITNLLNGNQRIDTRNLAPGFYLLKIETSKNLYLTKIIIH